MMEPLVSVITPVHNSAAYVADTIASVQAQTYTNWEMILVDDASTDGSVGIIEKLAAEDPRIKLYASNVNRGAAKTRNEAIEHAQGRYIAFLDSDDQWLPEKLQKQVSYMQQNRALLTHTYYRLMDAEGNELSRVIKAPDRLTYEDMLDFNFIGCLTAMYDAEKLGKYYMPDIPKRQDYALWLSIMRQHVTAHIIPEVLALYRTGHASLSSNKLKVVGYNWQILRELEKQPFYKAVYHFIRYGYIGMKKYLGNKFA